MTKVFTQYELNELETVDAEGHYVTLRNGSERRYLDFNSGYWCVPLGHRNREVRSVFDKGYYARPFGSTNPHVEKFAETLCRLTNGSKVLFSTTGSEAVDDAIRLAWQSRARDNLCNRGVKYVVSLKGGYHGSTGLALYVDGFRGYDSYLPLVSEDMKSHFSVKLPDPLKFKGDLEDTLDEELNKREIDRSKIASLIFEPVMGARGAVSMPDKYIRLFEKLQRDGVVLIADEVSTGLGRTGKMFGYEHYDLQPDMIVLGKGITNGEFPFAVSVVNNRIMQGIEDSQDSDYGKYLYGHTYSGHPTGSMMASKVLEIIQRDSLVDRVREKGEYLTEQLNREGLAVRGKGLFLGIEFENSKKAREIQIRLMEQGISTNSEGDTLMVVPPYTISYDELDLFVRNLREVI